jgi:hypothetical protein
MLDLILSLILVVMSGARMGEMVGSKVVVQNNLAGRLSEVTTYMASDRRRKEMRSSVQRKNPDGSTETVDRTNVVITRCDLGQSFTLNLETKEYTASVFPPVPLTAEQRESLGLNKPPSEVTPTLRIETTTVDTGERKEFFGRLARHVIITTKQTPLEGSHAEAGETVSDGWYIDFERRLACEPRRDGANGWLGVSGGGREVQPEKPEFANTGPRESGFPVKVKRTLPATKTWPDGRTEPFQSRVESEVTQFEEGPLDPALFEVPVDFKKVERARRMPSE